MGRLPWPRFGVVAAYAVNSGLLRRHDE